MPPRVPRRPATPIRSGARTTNEYSLCGSLDRHGTPKSRSMNEKGDDECFCRHNPKRNQRLSRTWLNDPERKQYGTSPRANGQGNLRVRIWQETIPSMGTVPD